MTDKYKIKKLPGIVRDCASCPFMEFINREVDNTEGQKFVAGYFCLHREKRSYVITGEDLHKNGARRLNEWLIEKFSAPFPTDCPLLDADMVPEPVGYRQIEL